MTELSAQPTSSKLLILPLVGQFSRGEKDTADWIALRSIDVRQMNLTRNVVRSIGFRISPEFVLPVGELQSRKKKIAGGDVHGHTDADRKLEHTQSSFGRLSMFCLSVPLDLVPLRMNGLALSLPDILLRCIRCMDTGQL